MPLRRQMRLERAGQMRLAILRVAVLDPEPPAASQEEDFSNALEQTFPVAPVTEDELYREFCRLFGPGSEQQHPRQINLTEFTQAEPARPVSALDPITDADIPF